MSLILAGFLSGLGILVMLFQLNFKKVLGFSLIVDLIATVGLGVLFMGTFSGMIAGVVGGLTVTTVLAVSKKLVGYKKLGLKGWKTYTAKW